MSDAEPNDASPDEDGALAVYERHRAIVRETDKRFSSIYGYGGGAVLVATGAVFALLVWALGGFAQVLPWVLGITVGLISLFVLNAQVRRRRQQLRESIEHYCEVNELDLAELREYYRKDGIYPYFDDLFAERERT